MELIVGHPNADYDTASRAYEKLTSLVAEGRIAWGDLHITQAAARANLRRGQVQKAQICYDTLNDDYVDDDRVIRECAEFILLSISRGEIEWSDIGQNCNHNNVATRRIVALTRIAKCRRNILFDPDCPYSARKALAEYLWRVIGANETPPAQLGFTDISDAYQQLLPYMDTTAINAVSSS